ncbi:MAG: F0F1 ATP synthase subunit A [Candidatus Gastranaerophilales bacterium]|nr:F0F1 ATP synthase subunit A [Candidatus Gastranaerophilales bacterium]
MSSEHWVVQAGNLSFNMDTLVTMWVAMAAVIVFAFIATRKISIFPNKLQLTAEKIVGGFMGLTDSMIGKSGRIHIPILASLFLFILTANLMGQIPWRIYHLKVTGELASPTNDINMTAAMAIMVLIYYVYHGVRVKGFKFFLHEFSFVGIIMAIIELLEMIIRPFSLALRLFANILAGEILVFTFVGMCAYFLPLPFMLFEVFVAFLQTLVFVLLSTAYIATATQVEEH